MQEESKHFVFLISLTINSIWPKDFSDLFIFSSRAEKYGLDLLKAQPSELTAYQFQKWAEEQLHRPARDVIFVGHIQLRVEGLERMQTGYEPVISPSTIEFIKPSLGLLGHVHDKISHGKYHYSGDIVPDNIIEAEIVSIEADGKVNIEKPAPEKGFYIHTRVPGGGWENAFHPIETVKFCKVLIKAQDEADLAAKMETAQGFLKTRGEGLGEDSLVCKFDVETPDPAVSDAVFRHENTIRTSMGKVAEVVSPTINVTSFSQHAASVENKADWQKKDMSEKFHEWRRRRGFESNETEDHELDEKIRQVL